MGSFFSFPLLCIINLALYRYAVKLYTGKDYRIRDLPVLINGDDILFKCTHAFWLIWKWVCDSSGLFQSPGKAFLNKDFCMVNSRWLNIESGNIADSTPFLNMGLVTGRSKSVDSDAPGYSLREKLATLPSSLVDLGQEFGNPMNRTFAEIYDHARLLILERRRDIPITNFTPIQLGLLGWYEHEFNNWGRDFQRGKEEIRIRREKKDSIKRDGRKKDQREEYPLLRTFYWFINNHKDSYRRSNQPKKLISEDQYFAEEMNASLSREEKKLKEKRLEEKLHVYMKRKV